MVTERKDKEHKNLTPNGIYRHGMVISRYRGFVANVLRFSFGSWRMARAG